MTMNIFRLCGDMSHILAIGVLILQLHRAKNARGISVKTQELYLVVFLTRYLDLFTNFYSLYNSVMKVFYIATTAFIIIKIKYVDPIKSVYNFAQDSFPHWKCAVLPCAIVAIIQCIMGPGWHYFQALELLWTFSICLESIVILPQLIVLRRFRLVENLTGKFVFFLGLYRFLYIINWVYRSHTEIGYKHHWLVYSCGVIQTLLYVDFFHQYLRAARCFRSSSSTSMTSDEDDTSLLFELSVPDPLVASSIDEEAAGGLVAVEKGMRSRKGVEEAEDEM